MFQRDVKAKFLEWIETDEILIIYGPRQAGKTTFMKMMFEDNKDAIIFNCELNPVRQVLESKDIFQFRLLFGDKKIVALDEAQKITDIGSILKIIYDELKNDYKVIVTGSSSFDLSNKIIEPLTGRNIKFRILPLSLNEINSGKGWLYVKENLNQFLVFGSYPGIINIEPQKKIVKLLELESDYLYKDILVHEKLKNSSLIRKLLQSLALQVGSMVSVNELAQQVRIASQTVEKYLDLLEKTFVIYSLSSFSTNLRNELKKSRKYYFYDLGIRNAIINNFNPVPGRNDTGVLWENFCINEMIKKNNLRDQPSNLYFWRTYDGAEIDLIEEINGSLKAYEIKWNTGRKVKLPESFRNHYNVSDYQVITPENFQDFFLK